MKYGMVKWEYHAEELSGPPYAVEGRLNELGERGWELVHYDGTTAVLKQPLGVPTVNACEARS